MTCKERFLKYIAVSTASDEESTESPSTARQVELSRCLAEEMLSLGLKNVHMDSCGNAIGNGIFNASMMLALPEENRGAILGFVSAFSTGGCALSAVIYGALGDMFPLYLVFTAGTLLSAAPMLYMCLRKDSREFILSH